MLEPLVTGLITASIRFLTGARCRWSGCAPVETQRIYYANHTSHLDFVILWTALPHRLRARTRPVAAADYWGGDPLRRYLINRVFYGVLLDRAPHGVHENPLEPLYEALDHGDSLIFFPEGTRGSGDALLPFKPGIYHLARSRPQVDIVPVWMHNTYRVMPKGSVFPVPLICSVVVGEPSHLRPAESKSDFLERLQTNLKKLGEQ